MASPTTTTFNKNKTLEMIHNNISAIEFCKPKYSKSLKYWVDAKVSADFLKNVFKRCSPTMDAWFSCI